MARLLYLAGWGRSGSTLLGSILGEIPGVFVAGELHHVLRPGITCGCGVPVASCPFWQRILARAMSEVGDIAPGEFTQRQERVLAPKRTLNLLHGHNDVNLEYFSAVSTAIYRAAAETSGAEIIVDTSKHPGRAAMLALTLDPYMIHLVRDPRATVYSWYRRRHKEFAAMGVAEAAFRWLEWNLLTELVLRLVPTVRKLRIRYEDFVRDTEASLRTIAGMVGVGDAIPSRMFSDDSVYLSANHMVGWQSQ